MSHTPMSRFLIVLSDDPRRGRGAQGRNLYWFLSTYFKREQIRLVTPEQLLNLGPLTTDYLFVGVPTSVQDEHLAKVRFRRAVLFDYGDADGLEWNYSNVSFLLTLTDLYLKAWVDEDWDFGLKMGVLPPRRYHGLSFFLRCQTSLVRNVMRSWQDRRHDVAFMGFPTAPASSQCNQRVEWLLELKSVLPRLQFWGGLLGATHWKEGLERRYGDLSGIWHGKQRVAFPQYFWNLQRSKVVLTPAGNAPWTYRHYESIYSGAVVVSNDFRRFKTLIPLPLDNMVLVADRASVVPSIERALERHRDYADMAQENIRFLERYLHYGNYSKRKPELLDRFMEQLQN